MTKTRELLCIATVAMTPDLDPQVSRQRLRQMVEDVMCAHPETRLILFGEVILGWFYKKGGTQSYHESIAEAIPGPSTAFVAQLAREHNVYISFGLSERDGERLFNAQVLLSPTGEVIAKHRKFWIRNKVFTPGPAHLTTAEVDGLKAALLICADSRSLPIALSIRRERVDLVLASLADYGTNALLNRLMSALYDAWTVVANRYGEEPPITWHGQISITDPWTRSHGCSTGKAGFLTAQIPSAPVPAPRRIVRRVIVGLEAIGLIAWLLVHGAYKALGKRLLPRRAVGQ
jgi:predicted amidohydrolase